MDYTIREERIAADEYIDFLKRTDLGAQYPKERFEERINRLVRTVSISLVARISENTVVGVLFGLTDFSYWLYVTDLGVDRNYERQGIGTRLMQSAMNWQDEKRILPYTLLQMKTPFRFMKNWG